MSRLLYNQAIIDKLQELVKRCPDWRFGQILANSGIIQYMPDVFIDAQHENILTVDPFYEESEVTWKRMLNNKICFQ